MVLVMPSSYQYNQLLLMVLEILPPPPPRSTLHDYSSSIRRDEASFKFFSALGASVPVVLLVRYATRV